MADERLGRNGSSRRRFLGGLAAGGGALALAPAWAAEPLVDLGLPGGPGERPLTTAFPQKGAMILQRTRPPLLETPFEVFDEGVFAPNDRFFVRWHLPGIPTEIDVDSYRLTVRGAVERPLSLSLAELLSRFPQVELAAVNQCSGNSRGFFQPRVAGAQWANGAMGNALWAGVRLSDVLDRAGVKAGARRVRFKGLDQPALPDGPDYRKSLALDHARNGEVMLAFGMNGEQMPLLNGFPLRLVVPGWYSTYWVKMLSDIEVLTTDDDNYWTTTAYRVPDTPFANITPGQTGVPTVPISRLGPRSFITNLRAGADVMAGTPLLLRGIAFGGTAGVKLVEVSADGGKSWKPATLGRDEGKYGFRRWDARFFPTRRGAYVLMVRCTNSRGKVQPLAPNWNAGGLMRNSVETLPITVV